MQKKFILLILLLLSFININVLAKSKPSHCEFSQEYLDWLELPAEKRNEYNMPEVCKDESKKDIYNVLPNYDIDNFSNTVETTTIPTSFDLRNVDGNNYVTSVKNQKQTGTCWAHGGLSALESNILLKHNKNYDFSELHMSYISSYNYFSDGVNKEGKTTRVAGGGGNYEAISTYFTKLKGPILETEFPFDSYYDTSVGKDYNYNVKTISLSELENKNTIVDVNNIIWYQFDSCTPEALNTIKKYIMENGAIDAAYYNDSAYTNNNYFYHNGTEYTDHEISIIGWDDTISKTNFKEGVQPENDGAFIIKNSWGDGYECINLEEKILDTAERMVEAGWYSSIEEVPIDVILFQIKDWNYDIDEENNTACRYENDYRGYYYISYEDTNICKKMSAYNNVDFEIEDNVYYYDQLGHKTGYGWGNNNYTAWAANSFKKQTKNKELLTEVTIGTRYNTDYEIYISYDQDLNNKELIAKGNIDHKGYGTHKFDKPLLIKDDFSIIVKYTSSDSIDGWPIAVQDSTVYGYDNTKLEANQSYVSLTGEEWYDLKYGHEETFIPSIKAYTNNIDYDFAIGEVTKKDETKDKFKIPITLTNINNQSEKEFSIKVLDSNEVDVTDEFTINDYIKANNYVEIEKKSLDTENGVYKVEINYDLLTYDTTIEVTNSISTIDLGDISFKSNNIYLDDNKIYDLYGGTLSIPVTLYNLDNNGLSVEVTDMNGVIQDFRVQLNTVVNNETSIQITIPKNTTNGGYTIKVSSGDISNQISFKVYDFIEVEDITFKYKDEELEEIILLKGDTILVETIINNNSTLTSIEYYIENSTDKQVASLTNDNQIHGNDVGTVNLAAKVGDQQFKIPIIVIEEPNITFDNITYISNVGGNNKIDNNFGGRIEIDKTTTNKTDSMMFVGMGNVLGSCISYDYDIENKVIINISGSCGLSGGESLQLDSGNYTYEEKIHVFDTKKTVKEFNVDYEIVEYIPLGSITSNIEKINLKINDTYQIPNYVDLTFEPNDATNKNIKYVGYDEEIIKINDEGTITALKGGVTTIKVISVYNETIYDTISVMVNPNIKEIESSIQSNYNNKLYYGYGGKVTATITTENIIDNEKLTIKYYKDNVEQDDMTSIFDTTNRVISNNSTSIDLYVGSSLEKGKYKIELSYENTESKSFEFEVIEPKKVTSIEASDIVISNDGLLSNIIYQVKPSDAFNQEVEFIVADTSIAKVEEGKIKGLKVGNTTLTIKSKDESNITKTVNVSVVEKTIVIDNIKLQNDIIYETIGGKLTFRISLINIDSNNVDIKIIDKDNNNIYEENVTLNDKGYKDIEYEISKELKAGTYTIKVTDENFEKTATFEVTSYKEVENLKFMYKEKELNNLILLNTKEVNILSIITNNDSTFKDISYSIKDTTIATVTDSGLIKGIKVGKTELIASVGFQTFKLPIEVIDTNSIVSESVHQSNISNEFVDVKYGGVIKNEIIFKNANGSIAPIITLKDSNGVEIDKSYYEIIHETKIINNKGIIEFEFFANKFATNKYTEGKELTVKYTYTLNDIDNTEVTKEYKVNLSEYNPITKINLSKTDIKLDINESTNINSLISVAPSNATNKYYNVMIDNTNVIKYENGYIKSLKEGNTKVTIISEENENVKATINVKVEKNEYLEFSSKVKIDNESGSKYIKGFNVNNTYKDLINNIDTNLNVVLKETNGTKVTNISSVLKTGMKLNVGNNTYDIVIKGDMSGDGKISITDLSQMRYHLAGVKGKVKIGAYKHAGDMNDSNSVTITDLSQMRKKLAGGK